MVFSRTVRMRQNLVQQEFTVYSALSCPRCYRKTSSILLATYPLFSGGVHNTLEKFQNAALFLGSGLPSTLTRHKSGAFENALQTGGNLKTPTLRFGVNGTFRCYHVISLLCFGISPA